MADYVVKLPDVGEGVAEAEIIAWHVAVGDTINENDAVVDVMTDKATVELPSPVTGVVSRLGAEVGDVVPVGSELIWIDTAGTGGTDDQRAEAPPTPEPPAGEEPAATVAPADPPADASAPPVPPAPAPPVPPAPPAASAAAAPPETSAPPPLPAPSPAPSTGRAIAAPAVRKRAQALGIDLAAVTGTGPDGRVGHDDLDAHVAGRAQSVDPAASSPAPSAPSALPSDDVIESVKLVGLRRNIAARMQESYRRIPHFTYVDEVDVTELERLRAELNQRRTDDQAKLSVLPFLMRAVVVAVAEFPQMNARFQDDEGVVQRHRAVHLGVAVQTAKGLMVPVVKHAEAGDVWHFAAEVARLSDAARAATVTLDELSGSTITITSLGALGGIASTPIINAPEVAIIGVNKIVVRPAYADGIWLPRQMMNLSSSFDHRVIDGWDAALFIQRIRSLLEVPALLFMTE